MASAFEIVLSDPPEIGDDSECPRCFAKDSGGKLCGKCADYSNMQRELLAAAIVDLRDPILAFLESRRNDLCPDAQSRLDCAYEQIVAAAIATSRTTAPQRDAVDVAVDVFSHRGGK